MPTPAPGASPTTTTLGGITLDTSQIDNTGTSNADRYGLGAWGQALFNVYGLFPTPRPDGLMNGDDVLHTFAMLAASSNPSDHAIVAAIQQSLRLGGYYSQNADVRPGVVQPDDLRAFASALTLVGRAQGTPDAAGKAPQSIPLTTWLNNQAQSGVLFSAAGARQQAQAAVIQVPNAQDIYESAQQVFQRLLGHKLTEREANAFARAQQHLAVELQRRNAQGQYDAQTGPVDTLGPASAPTATPTGESPADYLTRIASSGGEVPASIAAPGNVPDGSPADFRLAEEASMGHGPSPQQYEYAATQNSFIDAVQRALGAEQTATGGEGGAPPLSFVYQAQPPDVTTAAEQYAARTHPASYLAHNMADTFGAFLNILTRSGGAAG